MARDRRAVVVGAGVAGLASACSLAARGWTVTVLESRPGMVGGGQSLFVQPNGLAALEALGALEAVRELAIELRLVVFRGRGGRPLAVYDYGQLRHRHPYAVEVRRGELVQALGTRLAELGGQAPRFGSRAIGLEGDGPMRAVRFFDPDGAESQIEAELLIGADGAGSLTRQALGIGARRVGRSDTAVLGTVDTVSGQRELTVHCGPGWADGVAPVREGTYFWDIITRENRAAVDARDLDRWREVYIHRVPSAAEIVAAIGSWDELSVVTVRPFWATSQAVPGAALVGDAAGAVHPHSAQGANLALEDAVALGDAVAAPRRGGVVTDLAVAGYAHARHRKRRRYVLWSLLAARSMDAPNALWRAVRWSGFGWNRVGPVRRELLRRQAGLA